MKGHICKDCLRYYEVEENKETPFPSLTVLGGILGGVAGLVGAWILVPAAVFGGLAADLLRCEMCSSDEDVYRLMSSKDGGVEDTIYEEFIPVRPDEEKVPVRYRYDEVAEQLTPVEELADFNDAVTDFSPDYDFSLSDASLSEAADIGEFGEGHSASKAGGGNSNH